MHLRHVRIASEPLERKLAVGSLGPSPAAWTLQFEAELGQLFDFAVLMTHDAALALGSTQKACEQVRAAARGQWARTQLRQRLFRAAYCDFSPHLAPNLTGLLAPAGPYQSLAAETPPTFEEIERIWEWICSLNPEDRSVFLLSARYALPLASIAAIMECDLSEIEARVACVHHAYRSVFTGDPDMVWPGGTAGPRAEVGPVAWSQPISEALFPGVAFSHALSWRLVAGTVLATGSVAVGTLLWLLVT